jgi:hypothetical protein
MDSFLRSGYYSAGKEAHAPPDTRLFTAKPKFRYPIHDLPLHLTLT